MVMEHDDDGRPGVKRGTNKPVSGNQSGCVRTRLRSSQKQLLIGRENLHAIPAGARNLAQGQRIDPLPDNDQPLAGVYPVAEHTRTQC